MDSLFFFLSIAVKVALKEGLKFLHNEFPVLFRDFAQESLQNFSAHSMHDIFPLLSFAYSLHRRYDILSLLNRGGTFYSTPFVPVLARVVSIVCRPLK